MVDRLQLTGEELLERVNSGNIGAVGAVKAIFMDLPNARPFEFPWFDISDGDHRAKIKDDGIILHLWFREAIGPFPQGIVADERVISICGVDHRQVMVRVFIQFDDVDYLSADGKRTWISVGKPSKGCLYPSGA